MFQAGKGGNIVLETILQNKHGIVVLFDRYNVVPVTQPDSSIVREFKDGVAVEVAVVSAGVTVEQEICVVRIKRSSERDFVKRLLGSRQFLLPQLHMLVYLWFEGVRLDTEQRLAQKGFHVFYGIVQAVVGRIGVADPRMDLAWTLLLMSTYGNPEARGIILDEYERIADHKVNQIEYFEVIASLRRLFSILVSLSAGADKLGMRPEAVAMMKQQAKHVENVYSILRDRTGIDVPEVEAIILDLIGRK